MLRNIRLSYSLFILIGIINNIIAQQTTQTIRGTVTDKISQEPLPGVVIVLFPSDPIVGTTSDESGNFKINSVPVGKQAIKISFLGYKEIILQNLLVKAGKELVLNISMEENINTINQVEITAKIEKNKPLNDMSVVSTRTFSVEETQKFAAAVNDPGRMATSFAGVVQTNDGNNHISIRGNSPNGLLWRMEGVEIPNPNHFSDVGTSGGGISILSAQLLGNSDFSTGAFAAEYGNALSGVFDLKLRKGNNQKREYTFQAGVLGVDIAAEGPFKKKYDGSYLVNYRYSTLGLLGKIGVPIGDATTIFQDLSFNVSLPTKKLGTFGIFGFGGISYQATTAVKDSTTWKEESFLQYNSRFFSNTGAIGLTNTKLFKNQSYLKTALVFSGTQNGYNEEKLDENYNGIKQYEQKYYQNKITLSSTYTQKVNSKNNFRSGFILNELGYDLAQHDRYDTTTFVKKLGASGNTQTLQLFYQWNHKISDFVSTNIGLHYFRLLLNNSQSVEPRASVKYSITKRHNIMLGYGLHSQLQPIGLYFVNENEGLKNSNKSLGLSKANHIVIGYDWNFNEYSHVKTEFYYQHLFNIPVSMNKNSTYSILNSTSGYTTELLTNNGLGKNYGIELTLERFIYKGLYYLLSASIYESKYKAPNGNWYNTLFNTNYSSSFTLGKEWTLSEKRKNKIIGINIKSIYVGGRRYTPIDLPASILSGESQFITTETFNKKTPDYYRLDTRISLTRNYKKLTSTLALDLQNATNHKNVGGQYFDPKTGTIKYWYQTTIIPILSYKLEF